MTTEQIKAGVTQCASDLGLDIPDLNTRFGNCGVDSLDTTELVMAIERHFEISIMDEEIDSMGPMENFTLMDLAALVQTYVSPN